MSLARGRGTGRHRIKFVVSSRKLTQTQLALAVMAGEPYTLKDVRTVLREGNLPYNPAPSPEDIEVTKRLYEAGNIIGIDVLDHIIIGDHQFISLKEKGYF